jgi:hypothetical protein
VEEGKDVINNQRSFAMEEEATKLKKIIQRPNQSQDSKKSDGFYERLPMPYTLE